MCCKCSDYKNCDGKTDCTTTPQQERWLCVLLAVGAVPAGGLGGLSLHPKPRGDLLLLLTALGVASRYLPLILPILSFGKLLYFLHFYGLQTPVLS